MHNTPTIYTVVDSIIVIVLIILAMLFSAIVGSLAFVKYSENVCQYYGYDSVNVDEKYDVTCKKNVDGKIVYTTMSALKGK